MKKIDYYAVQSPWRMPKWVGVLLGGIFAMIAVGSAVVILQLTKSVGPPVAAAGAAPMTPTADPAAAPAPAPAAAPTAAAPTASADEATPADTKHHHHSSSHKKAMKLASAKHTTSSAAPSSVDAGKRSAILAKHDSKDKRREKDALDKLLGN